MKRPPKDPTTRAIEGIQGIIVRLRELAEGLRKHADTLDAEGHHSAAHLASARANGIDRERIGLGEAINIATPKEEREKARKTKERKQGGYYVADGKGHIGLVPLKESK